MRVPLLSCTQNTHDKDKRAMVPFLKSWSILMPNNHLHGPRSVIRYLLFTLCLNSSTRLCEVPVVKQTSMCDATATIHSSAHFFMKTTWSASVCLNPNSSNAFFNDSYQFLVPCLSPYKALCSRKTYFLGLSEEKSGGCSR